MKLDFLVYHNLSTLRRDLSYSHFYFTVNNNVTEMSVSFYHKIRDRQANEPVAVYIFVMLWERNSYLVLHENICY